MILIVLFAALLTPSAETKTAHRILEIADLRVLVPAKPITLPTTESVAPLRMEVVLLCRITSSGRLSKCHVAEEHPAGRYAGSNAIRIAQEMRVATTSKSGENVAGAMVRVPFHFR